MKKFNTNIIDWIDDSNDPELCSLIYREGLWGVRKTGILFDYSNEEISEINSCSEDIVYFAEKYCKIFDPVAGEYRLIVLRDYQKELLASLQNNRFNAAMTSRQTGITTVECIWLLHNLIFTEEKNIVIVDHKLASCQEKLAKVRELYRGLPFFLKPGVTNFSKTELGTERSRIKLLSASNPAIDRQIHVLNVSNCGKLSDETAQKAIEHGVLPCMSAIKGTKVFLSNTGSSNCGWFYKLFTDGEAGKNDFKTHRIYWWQVPGRDEVWKQKEIANLGSQERFDQEYNLSFIDAKPKNMPLPHFKNKVITPPSPIRESLFEVQASLPMSFLENITAYDLDVVNKRVTFTVQLKEETLREFSLFSTESIRILHHNTVGKVLISTELETITNPSTMSLSAAYGSDDLLVGRFTFQFGTIYQQLFDPFKTY